MRSFVLTQTYDATARQVMDAMVHPDLNTFLAARIPDLKERVELSRSASGDQLDRKTRCIPNPDRIPEVARGVVKPEMVGWVEDAHFDFSRNAVKVAITPNGFRDVFRFVGGIHVTPQGAGCVRRVEASLEIKMFVVGRFVEDYLIEEIRRNMEAEGEALRAFLPRVSGQA